MIQRDLIETKVAAELRGLGKPRTQDQLAGVAARVAVRFYERPWNEARIFAAAEGMARGLFGEAYAKAEDGQRWAWVDMCERAIRVAIEQDEGARR